VWNQSKKHKAKRPTICDNFDDDYENSSEYDEKTTEVTKIDGNMMNNTKPSDYPSAWIFDVDLENNYSWFLEKNEPMIQIHRRKSKNLSKSSISRFSRRNDILQIQQNTTFQERVKERKKQIMEINRSSSIDYSKMRKEQQSDRILMGWRRIWRKNNQSLNPPSSKKDKNMGGKVMEMPAPGSYDIPSWFDEIVDKAYQRQRGKNSHSGDPTAR
jgi:hypothetical protein